MVRQNTTQKMTGTGHKPGGKNKERAELFYIRSCLRDELGIKIGVKTGQSAYQIYNLRYSDISAFEFQERLTWPQVRER